VKAWDLRKSRWHYALNNLSLGKKVPMEGVKNEVKATLAPKKCINPLRGSPKSGIPWQVD
jgi:hypothetical protein